MDFPSRNITGDFGHRDPSGQHSVYEPTSRIHASISSSFQPPCSQPRNLPRKKLRTSTIEPKLIPPMDSNISDNPKTHPKSSTPTLDQTDVPTYEQKLKDLASAKRERKRPTFYPLYATERITMPYDIYQKLDKIAGNGDNDSRWPSISFNPQTQYAVIQWMPSPCHEAFVAPFIAANHSAEKALPTGIGNRTMVLGSPKTVMVQEGYIGSGKEADVTFFFNHKEYGDTVTATVEVGFSEKYEHLVDDVKWWIEGAENVQAVVLINVQETPVYRSPKIDDEDLECLYLNSKSIRAGSVTLEDSTQAFGPRQIKDLTWVGNVTVEFELWKKDMETGKATKSGPSIRFIPESPAAELDLKMSDFYPITATEGGNQKFPLTFDDLSRYLERSLNTLALNRCQEAIAQYAKRVHNIDDRDYKP